MFLSLPLVAASLLASCACRIPAYDTATRVADLDFSRRADGSLLACTVEDFDVRLRVVKP